MKYLRIFTLFTLVSILIASCYTRKKTKITTLGPNTTNPSQSVLNASGDGLTIGIPNSNTNRGSAISTQNASDIANAAISRANSSVLSGKNIDSLNDVNFVNRSTWNEIGDINKSKAILNVSKNKAIKDYATMILNDHQKIQKELADLTTMKNVAIPDSISSGLRTINSSATQMNTGSGSVNRNVDLEYLQTMIDDHQTAIGLFTEGSKSKDSQIASFATKNLPILRKHLAAAQELKKTLSPK
ncbi:MAG: DUF4142 domain-containing protein [Pedobacter sp.]|nr:MAG: DUF4142 domain-containing protein [Pedobacter sp.]